MIDKILLLLLIVCFSSCVVTGDGGEKHSKLDYLGTDHYESTGISISGVPVSVVKLKKKNTVIKAKICAEHDSLVCKPIRFKKTELIQQEKVIEKVFSSEISDVYFAKYLQKGWYDLKVEGYQSHRFKVDSYKINLDLKLKPEK